MSSIQEGSLQVCEAAVWVIVVVLGQKQSPILLRRLRTLYIYIDLIISSISGCLMYQSVVLEINFMIVSEVQLSSSSLNLTNLYQNLSKVTGSVGGAWWPGWGRRGCTTLVPASYLLHSQGSCWETYPETETYQTETLFQTLYTTSWGSASFSA